MNINPVGLALPCHAAEVIPELEFDSVKDRSLAWIWENSQSFNKFRGAAWMPEPCQSCDRKELDWGGCRCQAYMMTGDATAADPVCDKSPHHAELVSEVERIERVATEKPATAERPLIFRNMRNSRKQMRASSEAS